jgi:hypothetical protein
VLYKHICVVSGAESRYDRHTPRVDRTRSIDPASSICVQQLTSNGFNGTAQYPEWLTYLIVWHQQIFLLITPRVSYISALFLVSVNTTVSSFRQANMCLAQQTIDGANACEHFLTRCSNVQRVYRPSAAALAAMSVVNGLYKT